MPDNTPTLQSFYDTLASQGFTKKPYEEFATSMRDADRRRKLYDGLTAKGVPVAPSFEVFDQSMNGLLSQEKQQVSDWVTRERENVERQIAEATQSRDFSLADAMDGEVDGEAAGVRKKRDYTGGEVDENGKFTWTPMVSGEPVYENPVLTGITPGMAASSGNAQLADLDIAQRNLERAQETLTAPEKKDVSGIWGRIKAMGEGIGSLQTEDYLPIISGRSQAGDSDRMAEITNKINTGEPLSMTEQTLATAAGLKDKAASVSDLSSWYQGGEVIGAMAPYLGEMAMTSPVGSAVSGAVIGGTRLAQAGSLGMRILKGTSTLGISAGVQTPFMSMLPAAYSENRAGDYTVDENGVGRYVEGTQMGKGEAAYKALAQTYAEVFTEGLGEYGVKFMGVVAPGAKNAISKYIPDLLKKVSTKSGAMEFVNGFKKAAKFDGPFWEIGEEYANALMGSLLTADPSQLEYMFTQEGFTNVALPMFVMGAGFKAAEIPGRAVYRMNATSDLRKAERGMKEGTTPETYNAMVLAADAIKEGNIDKAQSILQGASDEMDVKSKAVALQYLRTRVNYDVMRGHIKEDYDSRLNSLQLGTDKMIQKIINKDGLIHQAVDKEGVLYYVLDKKAEEVSAENPAFALNAQTGEIEQVGAVPFDEISVYGIRDFEALMFDTATASLKQGMDTEEQIAEQTAQQAAQEEQIIANADKAGIAPGTVVDYKGQQLTVSYVDNNGIHLEDQQQQPVVIPLSEQGKLKSVEVEAQPEATAPEQTGAAATAPATQQEEAQQPQSWTIGKKTFAMQQQEDGSTFIPFEAGKDETKTVAAEVDDTQFDVVPVTEEVPLQGVPAFAKKKTQTVVKGVRIVPKQTPNEQPITTGASVAPQSATAGAGTPATSEAASATSPAESNPEGTPLAGEVAEAQDGERKVVDLRNTTKRKKQLSQAQRWAANQEFTEPLLRVMQYFAAGNKIHPDVIKELFGTKGKENDPRVKGAINKERQARIGYVSSVGQTIDQIATSLWESQPEGAETTDMNYRDIVSDVVLQYNHPHRIATALYEMVTGTSFESGSTQQQANEKANEIQNNFGMDKEEAQRYAEYMERERQRFEALLEEEFQARMKDLEENNLIPTDEEYISLFLQEDNNTQEDGQGTDEGRPVEPDRQTGGADGIDTDGGVGENETGEGREEESPEPVQPTPAEQPLTEAEQRQQRRQSLTAQADEIDKTVTKKESERVKLQKAYDEAKQRNQASLHGNAGKPQAIEFDDQADVEREAAQRIDDIEREIAANKQQSKALREQAEALNIDGKLGDQGSIKFEESFEEFVDRAMNNEEPAKQPEPVQSETLLDAIVASDIEKQAAQADPNPSDAQKEAGNYKKGHTKVMGFDVTIENAAGSIRSGRDSDGEEWMVEMQNHYGYFTRTEGKDGDQVDCFIGENPETGKIFIVDQINPETGEFDEHKVMIGFDSLKEAAYDYNENYSYGWKGLGAITEMSLDEFKAWLKDGTRTKEPVAYGKESPSNTENTENQGEAQAENPAIEKQPKVKINVIPNGTTAFDKQAQTFIKAFLDKVKGETLAVFSEKNKTRDIFAVMDSNGKLVKLTSSPSEAYKTALNADMETFHIVRYNNRGDEIDLDYYTGSLFGDFDTADLYDESGKLKETVKQAVIKEIEKAFNVSNEAANDRLPDAGKQPWEMTRGDYISQELNLKGYKVQFNGRLRKGTKELSQWQSANEKKYVEREHKLTIQQALSEGRPVPAEVLADYPELQKQSTPSEPQTLEDFVEGVEETAIQQDNSDFQFSKDDVSFERARRAYYAISFEPEKRGRQQQEDYFNDMTELKNQLYEIAITPKMKAEANNQLARYKEGYLKYLYAYLDAKGRTMSSMITGPAKFPTARNQKALDVENKRLNEFIEWEKKARAAAIKSVKGEATQEQKDDERWKSIKKTIDSSLSSIIAIDRGERGMSRPLFVNSISGFIKRMAANGQTADVKRALEYIKEVQSKHTKPIFAANNSVWQLLETAQAKENEIINESNKETEVIASYDGLTIENNYQAERVQLMFDEKPSAEVIATLKSRGFRWSAFNKAWQRKNTREGISVAESIANSYYKKLDDIRLRIQDASNETFYSPTEKALQSIKQEKGTAAQMQSTVTEGVPLFQIIGEQGAAALDLSEESGERLRNLAKAREMEAAEKDAKTIRLATGWERGADGKWRYETNDGQVNTESLKELERNNALANQDVTFDLVTYRKNSNGTYTISMRKKGAESTKDLADYSDLSESELRSIIEDDAVVSRILNGEGAESMIGENLDDAKEIQTEFTTFITGAVPITDVVLDTELFKAYPQLKDVVVRINKSLGRDASFSTMSDGLKVISIGMVWNKTKSSISHEIQHAIQEIEGFAKGGTPDQFTKARDNIKRLFKDIENVFDKLGYEEWLLNGGVVDNSISRNFNGMYSFAETQSKATRDKMVAKLDEANKVINENRSIFGKNNIYDNISDEELYRRLAGEAEARNVQNRMFYTPEQRRERLLAETEDVAREDQIILMADTHEPAMSESNDLTPTQQKRFDAAKAKVDAMQQAAPNALPTSVVNDVTDIADAMRQNGEKESDIAYVQQMMIKVKAARQTVTGIRTPKAVYIVVTAHKNANDVVKTWIHEQAAHHGLDLFFENKQDKERFLVRLFDALGEEQMRRLFGEKRFDSYARRNKQGEITNKSEMAEEFLAYTAEARVNNQGIWDVIKQFIRELYNNLLRKSDEFLREKARKFSRNEISLQDDDILELVNEIVTASGRQVFSPRRNRTGRSVRNTDVADVDELTRFVARIEEQELPSFLNPTIEIDGKQRPTTNSKGQPIATTEEGLKNFYKWFGESKVVDAEGRPLVVYHGTRNDFDSFENNPNGIHFGTDSQAKMRSKKRVIAAYLSISNPKRLKDTPGNWSKVIKAVKNAGHDGIVYLNRFEGIPFERFEQLRKDGISDERMNSMSDSNFRKLVPESSDTYIAFSPTQIKSATGNDGSFDPENPDIRFRVAGQPDATNDEDLTPIKEGMTTNQKRVFDARRKLQDRMLGLRRLQEIITERGGKVPDWANPYNEENRSYSKTLFEQDRYNDRLFKPLIAHIADIGKKHDLTPDEVSRYMKAKHSLERHESGTDALSDNPLDQWNMDLVNDLITDFESKVSKQELDTLWELTNKATWAAIEKVYQSGMMTRDQYLALQERGNKEWKHYVPLRGWKYEEGESPEETFEYIPMTRAANGRTVYNKALIKARGRNSEPDDPLGYISNIAQTSIIAGNHNHIGRQFLELMRLNKGNTDLYQIKELWYVLNPNTGTWEETIDRPDQEMIDASNSAAAKVTTMQRQLNKAVEIGDIALQDTLRDQIEEESKKVVVSRQINTGHTKKIARRLSEQHEFEVMDKGLKYVVITDPIVANAMARRDKPTGALADALRGASEKFGPATRWLTQNFTAKNPSFVIPNWVRDAGYAIFRNMVNDDGSALKLMAEFGGSMKANDRYLRKKINPIWDKVNTLDWNDPATFEAVEKQYGKQALYDTLIEKFYELGGATGYVHLEEPEVIRKKAIKEMSRMMNTNSRLDKAWNNKVIQSGGQLLSYFATMSENHVRFATFVMEMKMGKGWNASTDAAKNASVNFNRKGTWTASLGGLWGFFNAQIQGGVNAFSMAMRHKGRFAMAATAFAVTGAVSTQLIAMMLAAGDGGDNEHYTEYDMMNNILIPVGEGKPIKIPLPFVFRSFWALGVSSVLAANGDKDGESFLIGAINSVLDIFSPFDLEPTELKAGSVPVRSFIPTTLTPFYDWAVNKDFTGGRVYQDAYTAEQDQYLPDSERGLQRVTNPYLVKVTQILNKLGGGDKNRPATIKLENGVAIKRDGVDALFYDYFLDPNPAIIEHIVEYYLGGRGKFFNDVIKTSYGLVTGNMPDSKSWPIVNRFLGSNPQNSMVADYYKTTDAIKMNMHYRAELMKSGDYDNWIKLQENVNMSVAISIYSSLSPVIDMYNDQLKAATTDQERDEARKNRNDMIETFMSLYKNATKENDDE